ncbi:MAG: class F sortase [Oscillochloris sp.]|nr:class F sortase [Oscillochloris sp.]
MPTASPAPTVSRVSATVSMPPNRMIIDSIDLDRSLVDVGLGSNNTPVVPDYDVAWYEQSARPGTGENVVVWGHALRFLRTPNTPAPLERMKDAKIGDAVTLVAADGTTYTYVISDQIWALPNQVAYIMPQGHEQLTIVNCIGARVINDEGQLTTAYRLITVAKPAW